ncbi:MAG: diaminopimelate epimerase [Burkholderiales bacterium]
MRLRFTKMQGAGNDFVVLDATEHPLSLSAAQLRQLGDRRFGVGADQILVVERSSRAGVDFRYRIFNGADGAEVEQCGNGARCFVRYVRERGLTDRDTIQVETVNTLLALRLQPDGRVTVDMSRPVFEPAQIPFNAEGLTPRLQGNAGPPQVSLTPSGGGLGEARPWGQSEQGFALWPLDLGGEVVEVAAVSMGNPHAVQRVADVDAAPVERQGPLIEAHARFPRKVNAGFLQVVSRSHIRLRVFERGAGETLSCGTGACAAVVAGIRLGWLDARVDVDTRGGRLTIEWAGGNDDPVLMTGPAQTVFEGEIEL